MCGPHCAKDCFCPAERERESTPTGGTEGGDGARPHGSPGCGARAGPLGRGCRSAAAAGEQGRLGACCREDGLLQAGSRGHQGGLEQGRGGACCREDGRLLAGRCDVREHGLRACGEGNPDLVRVEKEGRISFVWRRKRRKEKKMKGILVI